MFEVRTLDDLHLLRETVELECKLAQGQDGHGEVPMGHALCLSDSFEPFEQTCLEMAWEPGFSGVLTKTPEKTPDRVLAAIKGNAEVTAQELALLLGKSESAIHRAIRKLRDTGQIRRNGGDKGGHWEVLP